MSRQGKPGPNPPLPPEVINRIETVQQYLDLEEETTSEGREPTLAIRLDRTGGIDLNAQRAPLPFRQIGAPAPEPLIARQDHRPPSPPPPPPAGRIGSQPVIPPSPPVPPSPSFGLPAATWPAATTMVAPLVPAPPPAPSAPVAAPALVAPAPLAAPPLAAPPLVAPAAVAPIAPPAPVALPIVAPPQPTGTIGQHFSLKQPSSAEPSPLIAEPATTPVPQRSKGARPRAVELVWAAPDAEERARAAPSLAEALGPAAPSGEAANKQRAVHRALARGVPAEDLELALWDSVDDDGVLEPPLVIAAGELELLFDAAEYALTLAPLVRPFADGDGEIGERIDKLCGTAERMPQASSLVERELGELRRVWAEREIALPIDEIEAEARRILVTRRKFRVVEIFQGAHLAALLRSEAHSGPVPVYLPEEARGRLPLDHQLNARLLVQLFPRQAAGEACPLAAAALAIARVVRS